MNEINDELCSTASRNQTSTLNKSAATQESNLEQHLENGIEIRVDIQRAEEWKYIF
jgi:hypothetical protein